MDNRTIGIIGSTGKLGKKVYELLKTKQYIILRQGRKERPNLLNYYSFNLLDKEKTQKFIEKCDIVVNCSGPSYQHSMPVFKTVEMQNKHYIDPFGANLISEKTNVKGIIFAGEYPGFTGVIIKYIKDIFYDSILEVDFSYRPSGQLSATSLKDFIDSTMSKFGEKDNMYVEGNLEKVSRQKETISIKGINYYYVNFITKENFMVAKDLKIKRFSFRNIFTNAEIIQNMRFYLTGRILSGSADIKDINSIGDGEVKYFITCKGIKNHEYLDYIFEVSFKSSETLSAVLIAECVERLNLASGFSRLIIPYELIDARDFVTKLIYNEIISIKVDALDYCTGKI